jgi:hypothetical protein
MTNPNLVSQLATDLFDVVKKYSGQMTAAELIGALELHKQELILHHFNQMKEEMNK